jgi:hypothetical protein
MKTDVVVQRIVEIAIVLIIWIAGFGSSVLHLWNWLMPSLFGLPVINFGQALGLMALCWLLFGGFRGLMPLNRPLGQGAGGRSDDRRASRLSPEQREKVREGVEKWCDRIGTEKKSGN